MIVYISGPISGVNEHNRPAFERAAHELRGLGHEPVNPLKIHRDLDAHRGELMKTDIKALLECDGIYMLPNWQLSVGAKLEHQIAAECGLEFI